VKKQPEDKEPYICINGGGRDCAYYAAGYCGRKGAPMLDAKDGHCLNNTTEKGRDNNDK
jgi:hypothetical protein